MLINDFSGIIKKYRFILVALFIVSVLVSWIFVARHDEIKITYTLERHEKIGYPYKNNIFINQYLAYRNSEMYNEELLKNGVIFEDLNLYKKNVDVKGNEYVAFKIKGVNLDEINKLYQIEKNVVLSFMKKVIAAESLCSQKHSNYILDNIQKREESGLLDFEIANDLKLKHYEHLLESNFENSYDVELITIVENVSKQEVRARPRIKKVLGTMILSCLLFLTLMMLVFMFNYKMGKHRN